MEKVPCGYDEHGNPDHNKNRSRGILTWKLSPFELRAYPAFFSDALHFLVRCKNAAIIAGPQLLIGYLIIDWNRAEYARRQRKAYKREHEGAEN